MDGDSRLQCGKRVNKNNESLTAGINSVDCLIDWDVYEHDEKITTRSVVNWPAIYFSDTKVKLPISVESFYQPFEKMFGAFETLREKDKQKYINTVDFFNKLAGK